MTWRSWPSWIAALDEIMTVRAQARRAGGDLVLAGPQSAVLRLLDLRDVASRGLVSASVDEVVSDAGSAPAAHVTPGAADGAAVPSARSRIVSSALLRGGAAVRHARTLTVKMVLEIRVVAVPRLAGSRRRAPGLSAAWS